MTKPKNRPPRPQVEEKLIHPPDTCPNWRDKDMLRHACRDHPSEGVCRCPCGALSSDKES